MTNWTQVLSKLNRDTQEGKLKWKRTRSAYDELYVAGFKEWTIGIFRYSDTAAVQWGLFEQSPGQPLKLLYLVQEKTGLDDLYDSIQRQHSKADDFARAVLDDDGNKPPF
jgi:hypothetical protein